MKKHEFLAGDNECIDMVRTNRACYPKGEQLILMNTEQAKKLAVQAAIGKKAGKLQFANLIMPIMVGAMWIAGAAQGLCDMIFSVVSVAVCVGWAFCNFKWGAFNA